jgi:hypothetical protein
VPDIMVALNPQGRQYAWRGMMPFKSKAQRRKFAQLLVEGKISNQTFEEWNRETGTETRCNVPMRISAGCPEPEKY